MTTTNLNLSADVTTAGTGRHRHTTLTVGDLHGTGRNQTDAKADLAAKLTGLATGTGTPRMIRTPHDPHQFVLLYRNGTAGWTYCLVDLTRPQHAGTGAHAARLYGTVSYGTDSPLEEVERRARLHFAHNLASPDNGFDPLVPASIVVHPDDRRELADWLGFQRAWQHAVATGANGDVDLHRWASERRAQFRPDLPNQEPR
jgi:hypothetical protein